jgi:hypothetical protein
MPRFLRYLRIAFSATCLIACVLLIVLWVRSFWLLDGVWIRYSQVPDRSVRLFTERGSLVVDPRNNTGMVTIYYEHHRVQDANAGFPDDSGRNPSRWWFQLLRWGGEPMYFMPLWFLSVIVGSAAAVPWISWSKCFSLRTLLIATTLVAVVLGLAAWLIH